MWYHKVWIHVKTVCIRKDIDDMRATVADRGQVTIPKRLRERLGIAPRTVLEFREEDGKLVAEKVLSRDPVSKVIGCLHLDRSTDDILSDLRGTP